MATKTRKTRVLNCMNWICFQIPTSFFPFRCRGILSSSLAVCCRKYWSSTLNLLVSPNQVFGGGFQKPVCGCNVHKHKQQWFFFPPTKISLTLTANSQEFILKLHVTDWTKDLRYLWKLVFKVNREVHSSGVRHDHYHLLLVQDGLEPAQILLLERHQDHKRVRLVVQSGVGDSWLGVEKPYGGLAANVGFIPSHWRIVKPEAQKKIIHSVWHFTVTSHRRMSWSRHGAAVQ